MTAKKKDVILTLRQLLSKLKDADEIDTFQISIENEMEEVPTEYWSERRPNGWAILDLKVRFHRNLGG